MRVIVVGASTGIGHFLATALQAGGAQVWGVSRHPPASEPAWRWSACDATSDADVAALAARVGQDWASVHAVIICAGTHGALGPALSVPFDAWMETVRLNVSATSLPIRHFFPLLSGAGTRGKIVCFSGGGATAPRPNFSAYGIAKCAIVRLVETLAAEWTDHPVDINAIAPGPIFTPLTEQILAMDASVVGAVELARAESLKQGKGASLERVLGLVEFLLSPRSDRLTGKLLSAQWDEWETFGDPETIAKMTASGVFSLRRLTTYD